MSEEKKEAKVEEKPNIFQRMLASEKEVQTVPKNLSVSTGRNGSYKAVSEADVLRAIKDIEAKHGVYSYPFARDIVDQGTLTKTANGYESKQFYLRLQVTYRFVNVDKPDEYMEITSFGDGIDSGDKAPGKAMTYADKYALMKAYKMVTGEDPDQAASEEYQSFDQREPKPMASDGQKASIKKLMEDKKVSNQMFNFKWRSLITKEGGMTAETANKIIRWLMDMQAPEASEPSLP